MRMKRGEHVEEQKGPIVDDMPTYKTMLHQERLTEREAEMKELRDGMTLHFHQPKQK